MGFENIDLEKTPEPQVVKAVIEEIKTYGDNIKGNYDELRKNHEELKKVVDEQASNDDTLIEEKFQKLSQDIVTRQEALDDKIVEDQKKFNERADSIEVALQRLPRENTNDDKLLQEAKRFAVLSLAVKRKGEGVSFEEAEKAEGNIEAYKQFCKSFEMFIRKYGGSREQIMEEDERKALSVGIDPDGGLRVQLPQPGNIRPLFVDPPARVLLVEDKGVLLGPGMIRPGLDGGRKARQMLGFRIEIHVTAPGHARYGIFAVKLGPA